MPVTFFADIRCSPRYPRPVDRGQILREEVSSG